MKKYGKYEVQRILLLLIKPFSKILKDNNILNLEDALKCEELFAIDNGQTLCKKCHKNTDTYGVNAKYVS